MLTHLLLFSCQVEPNTNADGNSFKTRQVDVKLNEGTNMAAAVSPDGQEIVIDLQGSLWLLPYSGGEATQITDKMGDARQPAWSPDGQSVVFQGYWDGNWHIYIIDKDGTNQQQLTTGKYDHREPEYSPDGNQIVFSSDRAGNYDIWTIDIISKNLSKITKADTEEVAPTWSGEEQISYINKGFDNNQVIETDINGSKKNILYEVSTTIAGLSRSNADDRVYFNKFEGVNSSLEALDSNGTIHTISSVGEDVFPFRISEVDNDKIVYTSDGLIKERNIKTGQVKTIPFSAMVQLERHNYQRLVRDFDDTAPRKAKGIYQPTISADGEMVAFVSQGDIWYKRRDSEVVQVTHDQNIQLSPAWSPDFKYLAYASDIEEITAIWIYELSSQSSKMLTKTPDLAAGIAWSNDGQSIAYSLNFGPRLGIVRTVDVVKGEDKIVGKPLPFNCSAPTWSADDQLIAVSMLTPYSKSYREGINRIVLMAADGSATWSPKAPKNWSLGMRVNDGPKFSPDGRKMAFVSQGFLWTVTVDEKGVFTGAPTQITDELTDSPGWVGDSETLFYQTPNGLFTINQNTKQKKEFVLNHHCQPNIITETLVIQAGQIFDGWSESLLINMDIIIKGNRIVGIEEHDPDRSADQIIDATNQIVMPGLIDIHAHQGSFAGEVLGRKWLAWGVTATRDPATNPYDALSRKEGQQSGALLGPRVFFTGSPFDGNRVYYDGTYALQSKEQMYFELDRAKDLEYDLIKTYVRLPDEWQQELVSVAHEMGVPITSHEVYPASGYGIDAVEHILGTSRRGYTPKMTATFNSYSDVTELIGKAEMSFTPTIGIYVGYNYMLSKHPEMLDDARITSLESERMIAIAKAGVDAVKDNPVQWETQFTNAAKMIKEVHDAGGTIVAGTDGPIVPYGFGLHVELMCYEAAGLSPFEVLKTATSNAAYSIGVGEDMGTVAVGKLADLIILNQNPLESVKNLQTLSTVVLNGNDYQVNELIGRGNN